MKGISDRITQIPDYDKLIKSIKSSSFPLNITGVSGAQKAYIIFSLYKLMDRQCIVVTHNEFEARRFAEDISYFVADKVEYFPPKELVLHDVDAMSREITESRLAVLGRLIQKNDKIIVTTIDALMQKLPLPEVFGEAVFSLRVNDEIKMEVLLNKFVSAGYERVELVDAKGQFAVRGGIIDFFPFSEICAYRIEMFGDTVDSIRRFDPSTQRSIEMSNQVTVLPVMETIIAKSRVDEIAKSIESEYLQLPGGKLQGDASSLRDIIYSDIEKLRETASVKNADRYFTHINKKWTTILDYCSPNCAVFLDEPQRSYQKAETVLSEFSEMYKTMLEKNIVLPSSCGAIVDSEEAFYRLQKSNLISLSTLVSDDKIQYTKKFDLEGREIAAFPNFEQLYEELNRLHRENYMAVLLAGNRAVAQRINQELRDRGLESIYYDTIEDKDISYGNIVVTHGIISGSFEFPAVKFAVISDRKLFGEEKKAKRISRKKETIEFTDLNIGDYVVHHLHGIGCYMGIEKLVVEGTTRDYLKISYHNNDILYIPTTQLEVIQKYIGSEGKAPKLSKFGGTDWAKTKKKVKESLKDIANELIAIYAKRQAAKGHLFSEDTVWQKQFEEQFPYEETEDQLNCIEEVKRDMESEKVMDRLLCGDVGVGKTEVAIRAAFKAAIDGKQVAYLVPTTILAQQQFNTFLQRMRDFPVKVEMLSRFRTMAQQKKIIREVKNGSIDILIGTHRIIQKDIQFKDLGLLIIDEEQRFGVAHKEKIRALKSNVDVLTLTATPIPRTLHMALTGIRDMSAIYDPPEDRHPIQTFVMEHDREVIKEAIIREISRNGQVFYLSNRVNSINKVAAEIQAMAPQISVIAAHGQMDEKELEDIMMGFIEGKWNVLVCTTIIESGLDIPNVNTIIIEDADKMGLAQLYQLRGRVGRAKRLAYAYLTYRKDKVLSEDAEKRLKAIKDFTEFGSGFKIAMRDLEIRGAGNLVGAEQHGHIEAVGYDTYCRLLEASVKELKGEEIKEEVNTLIDINVSAYINDDYIKNEAHKIEMYKKIASVMEDKDIEDIEDELIDRYGDIPPNVYNLLEIGRVKMLAKAINIGSISDKTGSVIIQFKGNNLKLETLSKLVGIYKRKILFNASNPPYITFRIDAKDGNKIKNIKNLLQDLKKLQGEEI